MLYYLFRALEQFGIPGSALWSYISFRSLLALILGLIISMWFGEYFIKWMKRRNIGETARDASIDPFGVNKVGVPSMGGLIIILAILIPTRWRTSAWIPSSSSDSPSTSVPMP